MPSRTTSLHGFRVEVAREKPTAAINPGQQDKVIGAIIKLDGRASIAPGGEELTYTWSFVETPLGSEVAELTSINDEGSVVTFVPDKTGQYVVGLVVDTGYRESEQVTADVDIQAILTPYTLRTTPDGSIMFKMLSSFWRMVEQRQVFSTIWSGYMQLTGADLLRIFQVDYAKSIETIQNLYRRRWLAYSPRLDLEYTQYKGFFGHNQSGDTAFTASGASAAVGAIISSQEVLLLDGTPSLDAVGETLRVFTSGGGNTGEYLINRLNSSEDGYIVSASTPFPSPSDEVLSTGEDLVTFSGNDQVYVADVTIDFSALGVRVGDVLRIEGGGNAGYHRITGVGTADGLTNERTLQLEGELISAGSGQDYSIFKALRIYALRTASPTTNTVYIPQDDADLDLYETEVLKGTGSVEGAYELAVESRHVFSALVGQQIKITSGEDGGKSFTITGLNESGTGYLVGSTLSTTTVPRDVSYEIPSVADASDRLLVLNGRAYEILTVTLDEDGVDEDDGGYGPVWVITLSESAAPSSQEGMDWRIAGTLESDEFDDMEQLGVVAGDLLILQVVRGDNQYVAEVPCTVLGAVNNKVAFDIGTEELVPGSNGTLTDAEILALAEGLRIPRVYPDPLDPDSILITLVAAEIQTLLKSTAFASDYYNLPITSSTDVDLESYTVRVRPSHIIRNCRIPVDASLISVPSLFEYIDEPAYGTDSSGQLVLASKDGRITELDREPLEFIENRDYTITSDSTFTGANLQTTAGSDRLTIPSGDLIDRDVRTGDYIEVQSGFDQGRYVIQAVLDSETVQAVTELGETPNTDATGLEFTLVFRNPGNYLRFVDGMFTPDAPAPDRFWAQTSLFDNSDYIEANFGVLVGVTKDQLDEYGTSQVSYKGAVQALMFSWANGPTLRNISIGCHILVGLPVTEVNGTIIQIDEDYDTDTGRGRILIEDTDSEGNGTGLVRVYYYSVAEDDSLSAFAGLAINPKTGAPFAVLDVVSAFTPLSNSVLVDDYVSDPRWWAVGGASGADEVQKFHTWQVQLDAHEVDSRDVPLVVDFCMGIRPIYTKPKIVLVLYLYDEVTVEDDVTLEASLFFSDDPVLSKESTHMVDSYNGSSLPHRVLDHGSLSTRTLFEGRDLVTTAGSGTVSSARGGFSGTLDADPLDHAPNEALGVLEGVNSWFGDDVYYRGTPLVRAGDILYILEGVNRGRYRVTSVTDDTSFIVEQLDGWPPRTRDVSTMEAATGQLFQIQREEKAELVESVADGEVDSYDAGTDTTVISSATGNFRWNGVAVGDKLLVEDGADFGVHIILQVGEIDGFGDIVNMDTKLTVGGELTEAGSFTFTILREGLRTNPLVQAADGATSAGSDELVSAATDFLLLGLVYGDELTPTSGTDADKVFKVIDTLDNDTIVLDRAFTATESSVSFKVTRPSLFEEGEEPDPDWLVERLCAFDDVSLVLVEPLTAVLVLADLNMTGGASTATSATDMAGSGVTAGMRLEIDNAHDNSGVFRVESVVTTTVTIEETWHATESPVSGTFYSSAADWSVENDTVTLSGGLNLEFGPMVSTSTPEANTTFTNGSATVNGVGTSYESTISIGDVVRLQADDDLSWAVVSDVVSDTELTLDRTYTGTGGTGTLQVGVPGGLVRQGDEMEIDTLGLYVVKSVAAATVVLTRDTGVSPAASYTGRIIRRP